MIQATEIERPHGRTTQFTEHGKLVGQQTGEFVTVVTARGLQLRNVMDEQGNTMARSEILGRLEGVCR